MTNGLIHKDSEKYLNESDLNLMIAQVLSGL